MRMPRAMNGSRDGRSSTTRATWRWPAVMLRILRVRSTASPAPHTHMVVPSTSRAIGVTSGWPFGATVARRASGWDRRYSSSSSVKAMPTTVARRLGWPKGDGVGRGEFLRWELLPRLTTEPGKRLRPGVLGHGSYGRVEHRLADVRRRRVGQRGTL